MYVLVFVYPGSASGAHARQPSGPVSASDQLIARNQTFLLILVTAGLDPALPVIDLMVTESLEQPSLENGTAN